MECLTVNTANARLAFGKHCGELVTRIPVSYLRWLVIAGVSAPVQLPAEGTQVSAHRVAAAEMERRGERLNSVEISAHSVDRFSVHGLSIWRREARKGEGMYSFIERVAASLMATDSGKCTVEHLGLRWIFDHSGRVPVLKTVVPYKANAKKKKPAPKQKGE